jgi:O-antigen ligase
MQSLPTKLDVAARMLTLLGVTLPLVSIALSQVFLACAILAFGVQWFLTRRPLSFPPIAAPLLLFMLFTIVSLAFSPEPFVGRAAISKFWLFAIILLVVNLFTKQDVIQTYLVLFVLGVAGGLLVIGQFLITGNLSVDARLTGFMGHWMTLSGELMLVFIAGAGWLLFGQARGRGLWLAGLTAVGVALTMTLTRSVWLATLVGSLVLVLMKHWHWRTLLIAALTVGALLPTAPVAVQRRVNSVADMNDPANAARIAFWRAGLRMVQMHPWVGVGPQRISKVFYDYHLHPEDRNRAGFFPIHLHNNLLQFAAERGIPCAVAWLWLMLKLAGDHWTRFRRTPITDKARAVSAVGFTAVVVLFLAGLFEFNFGDSEVLMVFLFLVTAPYAMSNPDEPGSAVNSSLT